MTAEEAILERIKELEGDSSSAHAQGPDLFLMSVQIVALKWVLSLLKTDRMALAKLIDDIDAEIKSLKGTRFAHYGRNKIRAQCLRDWLPRIKQLESKSEMR